MGLLSGSMVVGGEDRRWQGQQLLQADDSSGCLALRCRPRHCGRWPLGGGTLSAPKVCSPSEGQGRQGQAKALESLALGMGPTAGIDMQEPPGIRPFVIWENEANTHEGSLLRLFRGSFTLFLMFGYFWIVNIVPVWRGSLEGFRG